MEAIIISIVIILWTQFYVKREKKEEMKEGSDERRKREKDKAKRKTSWTLYDIPGANPEPELGWWQWERDE